MDQVITPELLLRAYAAGVFPMAESATDPTLHWVDPRRRGILPLDGFHISRSLRREILRGGYDIRANTAFEAVVAGCADRDSTWINDRIFALYLALHQRGFAHSLEMWEEGQLVGGVYGVALGQAFFAESMFSRRRSASKIVLAWLMHRLRAGGFILCDTQFLTPHLATLGGIEIPRAAYQDRLQTALQGQAEFAPPLYQPSCGAIISSPSSGSGISSI
ncbi:leucyl/phenylalanyl-tRNA--protein transferase [Gemmobacter fulvus]|uniref:leucyl/phenylalanyl-tRNA--protein transferase n=1 Tax=Gemmobacter fulvus TaxID=2840474 RepID=UPI002796C9B9|nr:leucyl/phenylalanyl-tRNA--protein transferase [Gemmobacter fulvus]MDQ1848356.1 leucyl/phenylalanyl-tRNA--protein transferase [Gemmobacter fulvus]